jgi:cytochrome c-type biogenesis protein CcmH/NrfG
MKQFKEILLGVVVLCIIAWLITFVYRHEAAKQNKELAKRIMELSPRGGPPETIDGLRQAIALYEDQIERNVREGAQTGVYWKILGIRLADRKMHNDALEAFEKAIYFNGEDPTLFYLTGLSAGFVAKDKIGFSANDEREKARYFTLSENSYKRALELDVTYTKAMYGLAVLYVFEFGRPQDGIVQLERYLQIQPSDVQAMFVLARAYFDTEQYSQAVEVYDRIAARTKNKEIKNRALENREIIQGIIYG